MDVPPVFAFLNFSRNRFTPVIKFEFLPAQNFTSMLIILNIQRTNVFLWINFIAQSPQICYI